VLAGSHEDCWAIAHNSAMELSQTVPVTHEVRLHPVTLNLNGGNPFDLGWVHVHLVLEETVFSG
jgi:hypothetical protein